MNRKSPQAPESEHRFEYDLNPYESFMRKHLQHYGYYTGRNSAYKNAFSAFADWDKTQGMSDSSSCETDDDNKNTERSYSHGPTSCYHGLPEIDADGDNKTQEELLRTTQLVYSYQAGKMVPKLREPRQLFGLNPETGGFTQGSRWPSEIQVLNEKVVHILDSAPHPEPFYVRTGSEKTPMSRSHEGHGRTVYEYEPVVGSFFLRSRVGGCRTGCTRAAVELESEHDKTLIFESRFESGNLYKAVKVGEFDYELWLRNDLYTNKHTQWFYFRVSNTRANQTYRFTIVNLIKPDSLYNNGMKPVSYSEREAQEKKIGWIRSGNDIKYYRNNIRYSAGKQDRWYYSLTWTSQFTHDKDTVYFSHCYPYTYTNMQDYLNDIASDPVKCKLCKQRVLCRTLAGNLVYVLTITSPTKTPEEMKHRKAVVITSRVHPGESNSSWMMKGFMDYLLGSSADAKLLRDTFVFKLIPMLNPDGVIVGNYRCSLAGRDLNRNYKTVLKDSFPSVWHTKTMIRKLLEEREVIVYCDLHGHSRRQNVFIYGCENRGNPQRRLRERIFPVMLSKNAPDKFLFDYCKFKVQKSKEGTGRIVMWNMGILNSFTMEATFAGSGIGKKKGYHFSMADLEAMGYHFCDTLLDYCDPDNAKVTNIMADLEVKMRQEILQHLKLREGQELPDVMDISLDDAFSTDLESSDGGSDSSVSDGLPAHLQYIAQKTPFPKKKRLKTRKERDKHKCGPVKDDGKKPAAATPVTTEAEKKDSNKPRPKLNSTKRPKSLEDQRSDRVNAATSTKDLQQEEKSKKAPDAYLEALTNVYLRSGVLTNDHSRDIPHFRYTAANVPGGRPVPSVPLTFEGICPHQDQAFAAQYVANHLQQFKYPDDLSELPKYKYNLRGSASTSRGPDPSAVNAAKSPSMLERRLSGRHIVELSAAQSRQQDLIQAEAKSQEVDRDDMTSPIKQHPAPFDEALERQHQHAYEFIKRGGSAKSCRVGSGTTVARARSARSHSAVSRRWGEGANAGLETNVMLGPAQPEGDLWGQSDAPRARDMPNGNTPNDVDISAAADTRQNSLINLRARSARSRSRQTPTDGSTEIPYVPAPTKPGSIIPPSTSDYVQVKNKEKISSVMPRSSQAQNPQSAQGSNVQAKPKPLSKQHTGKLHTSPVLPQVSTLSDQRHASSPVNSLSSEQKSTASDQKHLQEEITSTMQSISEISESLLDPEQRANLSPTTGHFVEHFVKKTEAEISDIAAELQQLQSNQSPPSDESSRHAVKESASVERNVNCNNRHNTSSDSSGDMPHNGRPAIIPKRATKLMTSEGGRSVNVTTTYGGSHGNRVIGESYDAPVGRHGHGRNGHETRDRHGAPRSARGNSNASELQPGDPDMAQLSLANITLQAPASAPHHHGNTRQITDADYYLHRIQETGSRLDADIPPEPTSQDTTHTRPDLNHTASAAKRMC